MFDDGKIERAAVVHDLAGEFCGSDGLAVIGYSDDAGVFHRGNFGDSFALAADAGGADRPYADAGGSFDAIENEARDAGVVVHRPGVGHAAHGGEAAASRGTRAGFDSLGRFLSRFAKMGVEVNEAGSNDEAAGVE